MRVPGTLRPGYGQPLTVQIEIHQREACAQPLMIFLQPAISHLVEAEDALHDPEGLFHLGSYASLGPVLRPL